MKEHPNQFSATAGQQLSRPTLPRLLSRGIFIAATTLAHVIPSAAVACGVGLAGGPTAGRRYLYGSFVRLLQRLGPTFVKFGQIVSVRRDVLPSDLCDELAVLHDGVAPMSPAQTRRALVAAYGNGPDALFRHDQLKIVASGSIASVFRASWHEMEVALKLKRPGITGRMMADLALLEALVRLAERLPKCRGMPLGDLMEYVSTVILRQLDFKREAASLTRVRRSLAAIPGIVVPEVLPEACREGCIVMEFVPELDTARAEEHTPEVRRRLACRVLLAVGQMIFRDGFVHCDLHPGNLYVTSKGDVVILDAGFSIQVPDRVRRLIGEFFMWLSRGNGRRCAEIIIESAPQIPPGTDLEGFTKAVVKLVNTQAGPSAQQFAMMRFGNALFDLQREFGLYADSDFVFPLIALAVVEGRVRCLSYDLDFQDLGRLDGTHVAPGSTPSDRDVAIY